MLESIAIPKGVTEIEDYTFFRCRNLVDITIPDSVVSIGREAFSGCNSLTNITLPKSVTRIENNAFDECYDLKIHGKTGSYAQKYAVENGIPFVED